jgi:RNA polymerase sigma-70 factor (ECF subfamily)
MKIVKSSRDSSASEESVLLDRFRRGDKRVFMEIVSLYKDRVYSMAFRILGDPETAEECAQDIFLRVYQSLPRFEGRSSLSTWIYRVSYNLSLDYARKESRRKSRKTVSIDQSEAVICRAERRDEPESSALNAEQSVMIQKALSQLDPEQRELVVLCDIEGKGYDDIAAITGIPLGTVKSRIFRGRGKLRELLRGLL